MSLLFLVLLPFFGSLVAALLPTRARNAAASWAGGIALASTVLAALLFSSVRDGGVVTERYEWIPSLGIDFTLRADGFAWMFALLVTGIGALVALYARYYLSPSDPVVRFFTFFLAFMGAMLGVVLSGNIIQIVFFWELTSLFSFVLIGYWYHRKDARQGARMAFLVTGAGGLSLLAGVLVLGSIVGSYDLSVVLASGDLVRAHSLYPLALVLILVGALTKSAQFPFHFWLPHAMAAPTPVSAYLHSATMVKAGVFLLARFWPVLAHTDLWFWIVGGAGLTTLLLGSYIAIFQHDLKGLLAYSTISHLGLITLLFGLNSPTAAVAGVFHIMNHATFKASLFMAAGIIDHETGTRDIRRLSGLFKAMPITGTLALVASAAMAGVPLLNGFLSKEMFFAETVFVKTSPWVEAGLPVAATIAGVFAVIYSLRFSYDILSGSLPSDLPHSPGEPPRWMRVPVDLLVLLCLVVGIVPAFAVGNALAAAARPVVGGELPHYSLVVWHGFTAPFAMSLVAMIGGIGGYVLLRPAFERGRFDVTPLAGRLSGKRAFEHVIGTLTVLGRRGVGLFGTRRLQPQLFLVVLTAVGVAVASLVAGGLSWGDRPRIDAAGAFVVLWVIGMVCALGAAYQAKFHRLVALTLTSAVGLVVCLTFVWFSAPDLALTQLMVEVVTTVLFLLGLRWLPKRVSEPEPVPLRKRARRARDFLLAVTAGGGLAALSYAMLTRPVPQIISPFFLSRALSEGGGANVVNVMLVDFRGFDTLGEISVLACVALTVFALLRRFRPPREMIERPRQQRVIPADLDTDLVNQRAATDTAIGYMMAPAALVRLLLPIACVVALHLLFRGHNAPGGGFVGGLVVAVALIAQYIVAGTQWVEAHLKLFPARLMGIGLLLAVVTGIGAIVVGYPFLTTHTAVLTLPLLGEIHVPSATFFDLGVFAVVVGATLLILTALAHQSVRAHRKPVVEMRGET